MKCEFCGEDTRGGVGDYFEVVGWEQVRESGGANKITKRKRTGKVAHKHCMDELLAGRSLDQGKMF